MEDVKTAGRKFVDRSPTNESPTLDVQSLAAVAAMAGGSVALQFLTT